MPLERTVRHLTGLYDTDADPWGHLTRPYEREKYARTLDAMGARRFRQGLEVGCGIGALTELLAPRCDRLTSIECVCAALARARMRMAGAPHVILIEGAAPDDLPPIAPDLIVLSEVLYFMTAGEIDRLAHGSTRTRGRTPWSSSCRGRVIPAKSCRAVPRSSVSPARCRMERTGVPATTATGSTPFKLRPNGQSTRAL